MKQGVWSEFMLMAGIWIGWTYRFETNLKNSIISLIAVTLTILIITSLREEF